ncbi:MAG: short-chain dehydrogenase [Paracoccaceae bacterium]|nr:MAG: short-chain dehydrogenase [Paracoccaceae bacterium]
MNLAGFETSPPRTPRVVVLSGGGAGIGRAVARDLAARGHPVAILGRNAARLRETAAGHGDMLCLVADVADPEATAEALARAEAELGPVDIAIANAAIHPKARFLDLPARDFAATMRINIEGVANLIRPVLPGMLERNCGRIIVMGSLADMNPLPGSVAYSASKGALHALVKGIAAEIDRTRFPNVLINEISPGATLTAMSGHGHPPEAVCPHVRALIDLPPGGPSGRFFQEGRELHPGEGLRALIRRKLGLAR